MADKKVNSAVKFTVAQLRTAKVFADDVDIVNSVLDDGKTYTIEETKKKIDEYKKGQVD